MKVALTLFRPFQLGCLLMLLWANGASAGPELHPGDEVARRGGVVLTVAMIDERVAQVPEEIRGGYVDDPGRMTRLIDMALTEVQLAAQARREGIEVPASLADAPELAQTNALVTALLKSKTVSISDDQYEQLASERYRAQKQSYASELTYTLRDLFISADTYGMDAAKIVADNALKRARGGEDFETLIAELGSASSSGTLAGDIGAGELIRLPDSNLAALKALHDEPGFTEVLPAPDGWHIVQLVRINPPVVPPYESVRDQILVEVRKEAEEAVRNTYLRTFIQQPMSFNEPVIQQLITRYYDSTQKAAEPAAGSEPGKSAENLTPAAGSAVSDTTK
jgi:hypothetical protein